MCWTLFVPSRPPLTFTVCLRDDDAGTFEFRRTGEMVSVTQLVGAAVSRGRRVRCYLLSADPDGRKREERYLLAKGYMRGLVEL
jgi:hypothetical protein